MRLYDAHNHLQYDCIQNQFASITEQLQSINLCKAVVNGTKPADWPQVLQLAQTHTWVIPAIGLHPWQVNDAPSTWKKEFLDTINTRAVCIGEIGLDRWIENHDLHKQLEAFCFQLNIAAEKNTPVSIHCLKAYGPLIDALDQTPQPKRGLHLHAFNGSLDSVRALLNRNAYFSVNAGMLKPNRPKVVEMIRYLPEDRLLIETDAPDFLPAKNYRTAELIDRHDSERNHPANISTAYQAVADLRQIPLQKLCQQVAANFERYFLAN